MKKTSYEFFKTTFWVIKIYWKISPGLLTIILVTQTLLQLQNLTYAYVFGLALDRVIGIIALGHADFTLLLPILVMFVGILFVWNIISLISNRANAMLDSRDTWELRNILSKHLAHLGVSQLEDSELTNKTTRFTELLGSIDIHLQGIISILALFMTTIATGIVLSKSIPMLIPFFVLFFLIKFWINQKYIAKIWKFGKDSTEQRRKAGSAMGNISDPNSLKELIITKGYQYLNRKYHEFVIWHSREYKNIYFHWAQMEFLQDIGDAVLYSIGLYIIIQEGVSGAITIGTITFLIRTIGVFSGDLDSLTYRISRVRESAIRIKDARDIFEEYKPEVDGHHILNGAEKSLQIEASNISFKYPNSKRYVLKDLSLKISPGEKIAIVGENGVGKTTLVKLLARIYKVTSGEVRLNGININDIKIETWYDHLGLLFQDYNTYGHMDVAENVGIGRITEEGISDIRVDKALRSAQAMGFVEKYPTN